MNTLIIRKKSLKTWLHTDSILGDFIISKFYFNSTNLTFQIVEQGQSKRIMYNISDITLYNTIDGGGAETFATISELSLRLEQLNYPAFQYDGQITSIANLITEGTNITIVGDGTESSPYVISASGSAGGTPTLAEVLTVGGREMKIVDTATYDFIAADKSKYIVFDNGNTENITVSFDGLIFNEGDILTGVSGLDGFNVIINNSLNHINPAITTEFTLNFLDEFQLTCFQTTSWILTITRYNSSGVTPTLQEITTAGNTTTNSIYSTQDIATLDVANENGVGFRDDYAGINFIKNAKIVTFLSDNIVTNYGIQIPNKIEDSVETLAMLSDITGGSQTLAETLLNGNATEGRDIIMSEGDSVFLDNGSKLKKGTTDAGLGGNNGIALKCSLDYEFKWEAGTLYIMEQDGFTIRETKYNFNLPTVTDDDTKGFIIGSRWLIENKVYKCTDATTGSAVWLRVYDSATNLTNTPAPTKVTVNSSTGTGTDLTLADATNAGLLKPADFTQLSTLAIDLGNKQATLTETNFGAFANGLTNKATPLDADLINIVDTADTNKQKKVTFTNVKAFLKTYFDTLYQAILTASNLHTFVDTLTAMTTPVDADRMIIVDNSASLAKKITWANIKATLKTYFDTLYATTTQVNLRTREILQDFTAYTTTGVLTEQIISNQAITASDMKINSWLNFIATLDRTGTTNATVNIYVNTTSNSLSGAVKIATATITSTQSLPCFKRDYSINASSVLRGILFTANAVTDEIATQAQSTTTLTLGSAYYLITTVTLNNVADTVTQRAINLKSSK